MIFFKELSKSELEERRDLIRKASPIINEIRLGLRSFLPPDNEKTKKKLKDLCDNNIASKTLTEVEPQSTLSK